MAEPEQGERVTVPVFIRDELVKELFQRLEDMINDPGQAAGHFSLSLPRGLGQIDILLTRPPVTERLLVFLDTDPALQKAKVTAVPPKVFRTQ